MRRSTLFLFVGLIFLSFGYTTDKGDGISKIHLSGDLLIRTIPGEDIGLYSIANPADVQELGSIKIEGNHDVATADSWLYADDAGDLKVYDIADPKAPELAGTVEKVFEHDLATAALSEESREERIARNRNNGEVGGMSGCGSGCGSTDGRVMAASSSNSSGTSTASGAGTGGSMTRFIVVENTLYCVDGDKMKIFNIEDRATPEYLKSVTITTGLETVFRSGDHLFVGGQQGMYIYSVADEVNPHKISTFSHSTSCDPVVVDGDRAYVTLRGGNGCGGELNQLEIIDISDITQPVLVKTIPMKSPYGLAAKDGIVMVCDGDAGLKTLRTEGASGAVTRCDGLQEITPFDVIWHNDLAVVTAEEGFWLYDASNPCEMVPYGELEL